MSYPFSPLPRIRRLSVPVPAVCSTTHDSFSSLHTSWRTNGTLSYGKRVRWSHHFRVHYFVVDYINVYYIHFWAYITLPCPIKKCTSKFIIILYLWHNYCYGSNTNTSFLKVRCGHDCHILTILIELQLCISVYHVLWFLRLNASTLWLTSIRCDVYYISMCVLH